MEYLLSTVLVFGLLTVVTCQTGYQQKPSSGGTRQVQYPGQSQGGGTQGYNQGGMPIVGRRSGGGGGGPFSNIFGASGGGGLGGMFPGFGSSGQQQQSSSPFLNPAVMGMVNNDIFNNPLACSIMMKMSIQQCSMYRMMFN